MTFTEIILYLLALYPIMVGIFTPDVFWNTTRTRRTRKLFGDKLTQVIYIFAGIAIIVVGINQP
jgi:hypothetical protein